MSGRVFPAKVMSVQDASTLEVRLDLGFGISMTKSLPLADYAAPKLEGAERPMAMAARYRIEELFQQAHNPRAANHGFPHVEKYEVTVGPSGDGYACNVRLLIRENPATLNWHDLVECLVREGWGVRRSLCSGTVVFKRENYPITAWQAPDAGAAGR